MVVGCPQTITDDLSMPLNVLWDVIDDDDCLHGTR